MFGLSFPEIGSGLPAIALAEADVFARQMIIDEMVFLRAFRINSNYTYILYGRG